ncbi:hypothetical protein [Komagataeibacter sp. FNDCR2]|nr:hypothetical protein [Komagataeibacter sp. FNDCR2]MCE2574842.1 hypothetical protein [Komagataeibacter sp. FNDCR2]
MTTELVDILEKTRSAEKDLTSIETLGRKQTYPADASLALCHEGGAA